MTVDFDELAKTDPAKALRLLKETSIAELCEPLNVFQKRMGLSDALMAEILEEVKCMYYRKIQVAKVLRKDESQEITITRREAAGGDQNGTSQKKASKT
jgi:hypothetical protein